MINEIKIPKHLATPEEIAIWNANNEKDYEELLQWVKDNSIETEMIEIKSENR